MNTRLIERVCMNTVRRSVEMRNENVMLDTNDMNVVIIFNEELSIDCVEVTYSLPRESGCVRFTKNEVLDLLK